MTYDEMHRLAVSAYKNGETAWSAADIQSYCESRNAITVMRPEGYAFGTLIAPEMELLSIVVAPDAQKRGIGSEILQELLKKSAEAGATSVLLEVSAKNSNAIGLYERHGFKIDGRRPNYYSVAGDRVDALLLRKVLVSSAS